MNKLTYENKFRATQITNSNTVGEAKEARRLEGTLRKFWEETTLNYIKATTRRDLKAEVGVQYSYKTLKFTYDLKPDGSVRVEVIQRDEFSSRTYVMETFTILKRKLYS